VIQQASPVTDGMYAMQVNPVQISVPGVPSHLVFMTATPSPNPAINAISTDARSSSCGAVPLSALGVDGRHGHGHATGFFFAVASDPQNLPSQGESGAQIYHGDEAGACKHVHNLSQV
jgi:hypothetical protein